INGSKSEIIVVNPEDSNENERFIKIGKNKDKVFANKSLDTIRILGVWFKADKGDKHTELIVKKEILIILGAIKYKYIIHVQTIYIINTILFPRFEYRLKTTIWEDKKYEETFRPVMKLSQQYSPTFSTRQVKKPIEKPNSHANYGIPSSFNAQTK
ncbi:22549_t:CDS:2, partial [Rhizophagus irregularis]